MSEVEVRTAAGAPAGERRAAGEKRVTDASGGAPAGEKRAADGAATAGSAQAGDALLRIEHVGKTFALEGGELEVLRDVNLDIRRGEFVCVVGGSGCGKSTLLRIVAGLERPTHGRVTVANAEVTGPRSEVGVVFQEPRLFGWDTVESNIGFGLPENVPADERRRRVAELIKLTGLDGFAKALPKQLSGGMRQRVNIARSLISGPEVLLLDEPFGALDSLTRYDMQDLLASLETGHGWGVLMVTHDIAEAVRLSDRVLVMSDGVIAADIAIDRSSLDAEGRPADHTAVEDRLRAALR